MSTTFNETITLEKIICGACGITFAIPEAMLVNLRREAGSFYCPNGHYRGWHESDADRLRKQLEATQTQLRAEKCTVLSERNMREEAERKLNRVHKGVCPCCKRSFQNLQRHMKTKHPEVK